MKGRSTNLRSSNLSHSANCRHFCTDFLRILICLNTRLASNGARCRRRQYPKRYLKASRPGAPGCETIGGKHACKASLSASGGPKAAAHCRQRGASSGSSRAWLRALEALAGGTFAGGLLGAPPPWNPRPPEIVSFEVPKRRITDPRRHTPAPRGLAIVICSTRSPKPITVVVTIPRIMNSGPEVDKGIRLNAIKYKKHRIHITRPLNKLAAI